MAFLKFILVFFVVAFILLLATVYTFFRRIIHRAKQFQQRERTRQTQKDGNIIFDSRTPEETRRRIIPDEEGEYVEYEEQTD